MLSSVLSPDSMLATLGVAEEDRAALRQIWQTLSNVTFGLAARIYNEYRALTPEQRTAIRQNIVSGVNNLAQELNAAFNRNDIRAGLALLAHSQPRIEALPDEDTLRPRPTAVPAITYSTPTRLSHHSSINSRIENIDAALTAAHPRESQLSDHLLQQALAQSEADAFDADLAEALRQSVAAHQAQQSQEDDERPVTLASTRKNTPKKSEKKATAPVATDESDDEDFQKAIAASLEELPKAITPNLKKHHTNARNEEKNAEDEDLARKKKARRKK
ncbi:hypothetical protein [Candidatus Berkiella aquae]|uniref:Uncharacterized protein n=1 Tax=Candidatus Berkiella aquae TaxID=295108 RepID=A0A0Q9YR28_9GAMM|nr:hypothetical protein [Candidatus Berkiella aquae]MCS5709912.1 hypothetical protein [Candidatus Berkiella aquae]